MNFTGNFLLAWNCRKRLSLIIFPNFQRHTHTYFNSAIESQFKIYLKLIQEYDFVIYIFKIYGKKPNLPNLIINYTKEKYDDLTLLKKDRLQIVRRTHRYNVMRWKKIVLYISIKAVRGVFKFKSTRNSELHVSLGSRIRVAVRKEAKRRRRKSTCLKEAGCSLLANLVARPACHRTVIHFRSRRVVQPGSVKLLVLFQTVCDGWCAGRRYVGITRLRHLDEFAGIIECPMESQWHRMALHGTH